MNKFLDRIDLDGCAIDEERLYVFGYKDDSLHFQGCMSDAEFIGDTPIRLFFPEGGEVRYWWDQEWKAEIIKNTPDGLLYIKNGDEGDGPVPHVIYDAAIYNLQCKAEKTKAVFSGENFFVNDPDKLTLTSKQKQFIEDWRAQSYYLDDSFYVGMALKYLPTQEEEELLEIYREPTLSEEEEKQFDKKFMRAIKKAFEIIDKSRGGKSVEETFEEKIRALEERKGSYPAEEEEEEVFLKTYREPVEISEEEAERFADTLRRAMEERTKNEK